MMEAATRGHSEVIDVFLAAGHEHGHGAVYATLHMIVVETRIGCV